MEYQRELAFRFPLTRGEDVSVVQLALTALRTKQTCGAIDGIYGNVTQLSVMDFQRTHGLPIDGVVGPKTWVELFKTTEYKKVPSDSLKKAVENLPEDGFPLTKVNARRAYLWMMTNFGDLLRDAVKGARFDAELVCAIACKETAPVWLQWISLLNPHEILERCVFDASGDVPGTKRAVFPRNTAEFRDRFGGQLTDELIAEANKTRRLRSLPNRTWIYKGYGIFQYDLQHISEDPEFFKNKLWYRFDACLERFKNEMNEKLKMADGQLPDAVRRYNGTGPAAEQYRDQVIAMRDWLHNEQPGATIANPSPAGSLV